MPRTSRELCRRPRLQQPIRDRGCVPASSPAHGYCSSWCSFSPPAAFTQRLYLARAPPQPFAADATPTPCTHGDMIRLGGQGRISQMDFFGCFWRAERGHLRTPLVGSSVNKRQITSSSYNGAEPVVLVQGRDETLPLRDAHPDDPASPVAYGNRVGSRERSTSSWPNTRSAPTRTPVATRSSARPRASSSSSVRACTANARVRLDSSARRSSTVQPTPALARSPASIKPVGPAPTTTTSVTESIKLLLSRQKPHDQSHSSRTILDGRALLNDRDLYPGNVARVPSSHEAQGLLDGGSLHPYREPHRSGAYLD